MLAKIVPRFVISRVIMNSYYARAMALELLKQPLGATQEEQFYLQDAQNYYPCKFYGYLSKLDKPSNFENNYQQKEYNEACKRFKEFEDVSEITSYLNSFHSQVQVLYNQVQRNNISSNFFSQKQQTNEEFQKDVLDSIEKFNKLEDDLAAYPEWKDKITEEIGNLFHNIHNNLAETESKRNIFLKLNRQEYFI